MNPEDKDFTVTISLNIEQRGEPFADTAQVYYGMNYDMMQTLQNILIPSITETLLGMGNVRMSPEAIALLTGEAPKKPAQMY